MRKLNTLLGIKQPIVLASGSPRRYALLKSINLDVTVYKPQLDEPLPRPGVSPEGFVIELAEAKMNAALPHIVQNSIIITADTIVYFDGKILGKPESPVEAIDTLDILSGKVHSVYTGYCIKNMKLDRQISDFQKTDVHFGNLSQDELKAYVASGSPLDKAGSYGIQDDFGSVLVERIEGDYFNVVGLPLSKVYKSLKEIVD